jgi:hypothetical protein
MPPRRAARAQRPSGPVGRLAALPVPTKSRVKLIALDTTEHVLDLVRDPDTNWPALLQFGPRFFVSESAIHVETIGTERVHTRTYRETLPLDMPLSLIER